ncbi:unnamed protein product [Calypogeia fissa]
MWRLFQSPILSLPLPLLFCFFLFTISTTVTSIPQRKLLASLHLPTQDVYQFPNETYLENLAVRSNGEILVTFITKPYLYLINTIEKSATLIFSFPDVLSGAGITEVDHDMFYVAAGNFSNFTTRPRSCSIWQVDMRSYPLYGATVTKVTDTPDAIALNGVTTLSRQNSTILIADCVLGAVWIMNVKTGNYSIAIQVPAMDAVSTEPLPIGINGIKVWGGYLYFTNSDHGTMCRVPISTSGMATGAVEVLATGLTPDDFDLDGKHRPWIAQLDANVVSVLLKNGTVVNAAGAKDQLTVAGATSCVFGRNSDGKGRSHLLYCTTSGGIDAPVNGTFIVGGKVVQIDTTGF